MYPIPNSVNDAIKVLDSDCPKWYNRVNLDKLHDMMDTESCVIGQVYPKDEHADVLIRLFGTFYVNGVFTNYLNEWRYKIADRQLHT